MTLPKGHQPVSLRSIITHGNLFSPRSVKQCVQDVVVHSDADLERLLTIDAIRFILCAQYVFLHWFRSTVKFIYKEHIPSFALENVFLHKKINPKHCSLHFKQLVVVYVFMNK